MADKMGLVHLYHGDGKGKTTAAVGLAVRACGSGLKVLYCQFIKDGTGAELAAFDQLRIDVRTVSLDGKFSWQLKSDELDDFKKRFKQFFKELEKTMCDYDVLVLDEVLDAVNAELLPQSRLLKLINGRHEGLEIVMTGRNPDKKLVGASDYVTEMKMQKHPFNDGVKARAGIEY